MQWGAILSAIITGVAIPLAVQGIRWLQGLINRNKVIEKSMVDDMVIDALTVGVENVANAAAKAYRDARPDGKLTKEDKRALENMAIGAAREILESKGVEIFKQLSSEAVSAIVRNLVDRTAEVKATGA